MKKKTQYLIFALAVLGGLSACTRQPFEEPQTRNTHTVYFSSGAADTRTGITIENGMMTPDWRKTSPGNVHLYEIGTQGYAAGEDVEIELSEENTVAHFKADFPTDITIIVDPTTPSVPVGPLSNGNAKSANNGPYTYSAVIAQQGEDGVFVVPSVQYPDPETLIDPNADFLIGYSRKAYDEPHDWEERVVDLYFDRPVALSRLSISNFTGTAEKVKSVTIKASGLTGSAAYAAIDFEKAAVVFTPDENAEALTLDYCTGADAGETFEAYFAVLPGSAAISEIVVSTDQWVYTKAVGKEVTFSRDSFKNLKVDLATATCEPVSTEKLTWYKASVMEDDVDYIIVSGGMALVADGENLAAQTVTPDGGIIEFETVPDVSMIWHATANEIMASADLVAGHFTLGNGSDYLQRILVDSDAHTYKMGVGGVPATVKYYAWEYDGTYLFHVSNSSATYYCWYDEGWKTGYEDQGGTELYTSRPPQELSFSPDTIEYDLDGEDEFTEPELTGALGDVTYTSGNETVATVDPSTGKVTIHKAGTAVITATAAGNAQYQAGTASYTIVVTSSKIDTFYLVGEIVAGESYMIVSGGKAMTTDGSTLGAVDVTGAGEATIQISASEVSLFEAAEHVEYYSGTSPAGHYTLSYGGKYLQRHSDKSTQTGVIGDIPSDGKYYVWNYDGEHLCHVSRSGSSGTYYICYSSGWKFENESSPNTYLYSTTKPKQSQPLSFSSKSVSAVLGEPFTAPTLEGAQTTVSWTSSDEAVATVASDGTVTLVGIGTTTITATAAASEEYNSGTASYTLKVTDGAVPKWYLAEEAVDGGEYLIVSNGHVLLNDNGNTDAEAVTVKDGVVEYDAPTTVIWTATASDSGFTLTNSDKYLRRSSSTLQIGSKSSTSSNIIWYYNADDQQLTMKGSSSTYYLRYNSSWSLSTSSGTTAMYTQTPPKASQEPVFSETSVNFDRASGETFTAPTLSGAMTNVTYSSSKPGVATVDAETGAVKIVGTGTTTITASAEGTAEYKPATASYTIHVTDSSTPTTTKRYVLASSIEGGKDYIIVSGGYALKNDNGSVASVAVEPVDGVLEFEPGEEEKLVWSASRETSSPDNGDYTFQNDGKYIRRPSSGGTTLNIEAASSFSKYFVWLYDGTHFYHNNLGGSSGNTAYVYWLNYDGSSWKFAYEATTDPNHSKAKVTQLYVEE